MVCDSLTFFQSKRGAVQDRQENWNQVWPQQAKGNEKNVRYHRKAHSKGPTKTDWKMVGKKHGCRKFSFRFSIWAKLRICHQETWAGILEIQNQKILDKKNADGSVGRCSLLVQDFTDNLTGDRIACIFTQFSVISLGTSCRSSDKNRGSTVVMLTFRKTEIATSASEPKETGLLLKMHWRSFNTNRKVRGLDVGRSHKVLNEAVNPGSIIDTPSRDNFSLLNGFNLIRAERKFLRRWIKEFANISRGFRKSKRHVHRHSPEFGKSYQHLSWHHRSTFTLSIRDEWYGWKRGEHKKEDICNVVPIWFGWEMQVWFLRSGCEMSLSSWQMGKHLYEKAICRTILNDPSFFSDHWLNMFRLLRKTSQGSTKLVNESQQYYPDMLGLWVKSWNGDSFWLRTLRNQDIVRFRNPRSKTRCKGNCNVTKIMTK